MNQVTTRKIIDDCKVLIDDAEALIKAGAESVGSQAVELRQRLAQRFEKARTTLARRKDELLGQEEEVKANALGGLQDEGWKRLTIAVCVGVLAGLALRWQRNRSARRER